jgi:DNA segregation ATPase FtsK/SpoIIIE-like protein
MARSTKQIRRAAKAPDKKWVRFKLSSVFEGTVLIVVALVAGLALGLSVTARQWAATTLAYGWVPVGAWTVGALVVFRYRPRWLTRYWRWWVGAAGLAAITIGALSFFSPGVGLLAEVSLGGRWGSVLGGTPLALGVLKLLAIAVLTPLLIYPKWTGSYYLRGLRYAGMGLRVVLTYLLIGLYRLVRYLLRRVRLLLNGRYRRRWLRRARGLLGRAFAARPQKPSRQPRVRAASAAGDAVIDDPDLWNGADSGTAQEWEASEALPPLAESEETAATASPAKSQWQLPSINLLSPPEPYSAPQTPLQQMARHIENTLAEHGVAVDVKDIKAGPRIVRFGLVPGWVQKKGESSKGDSSGAALERSRVKVQSILTREKDLALALKTPYLRIEAPVPGEALVGLEVPNPSPGKVPLRKVMDIPTFQKVVSKGGLPIALGEDTGGNPVVTDLGSLPHMLIAGATGSGKSVCINSIIASLLFTKPPDQLRMLMVDPKRVELTPFNGIPHLIAPVIVDVDEVNPALRALMREMFRRYKQMEEVGTRNIAGYNAKAKERMPYLVLIVDELADLMMVGGFEVEQNLVRLAQLGRATGIHLVLATQRPSVNVVTGLLKANIPARVAFAVASQVDSRVILDAVGAEKLLGKGDMLLLNNDSPKPRRVQGTLVYDEEVDKLVEFWLNQKGPPLPIIPIDDTEEEVEDEDHLDEQMLERARELAIRNPHLSSSFLERRLKIGGQKAAQIIELLEEEGLVIPR